MFPANFPRSLLLAAGAFLAAQANAGTIFDVPLPPGSIVIDPVVTIIGSSTGTAAAGTVDKSGTPYTSTAKQAKAAADHAAGYNGTTSFRADYTIVLNPDMTVNSAASMVTFRTLAYTSSGTPTPSTFTTDPITITGVTLGPANSVTGFTFDSTNWYPATATGAAGLNNKGLKGSIDLKTGKSNYTASYQSKTTGAVYSYSVTGVITPEPSTWFSIATGLLVIGPIVSRFRRRR